MPSLPLCSSKPAYGTLLATVGLGSVSTAAAQPSPYLQQTFFTETTSEYIFKDETKACENETICTLTVTDGSNICLFDDGGPLYIVNCREEGLRPVCLYGVASYFIQDPKRPGELCTGGSVFTRVPDFLEWITAATLKYRTD